VDKAKIEQGIRLLLEGIGENPARDGLIDTPHRVAEMYEDIMCPEPENLASIIEAMPSDRHQEMVLVRDISFHSLCEHHLLPFFGVAHVAYIPSKHGKITGLSKIARLVYTGVMVLVRAEHLCMTMRGVRAPGTLVVTSAVRGIFRTSAPTRAEVLALIEAPKV
jgi:GTP cyclohydrolase I